MTKIEALKALFANMRTDIQSAYPWIQVGAANTGFKVAMQEDQAGFIFFELLNITGNKSRDYYFRNGEYRTNTRNILQIDAYIKDVRVTSTDEEYENYQSFTKETIEDVKARINRFMRISENPYGFGYMYNTQNWVSMQTMFNDNRFIERWNTKFEFSFVDVLVTQDEPAVIGQITLQEVDNDSKKQ